MNKDSKESRGHAKGQEERQTTPTEQASQELPAKGCLRGRQRRGSGSPALGSAFQVGEALSCLNGDRKKPLGRRS